MKIAYLIPEWPGQTHIFFWREMKALREMGVDVEVISTRRPPADIVCHDWSEKAMAEATYLMPIGITGLLSGLVELLKAGPRRLIRCVRTALGAEDAKWRDRLRMLALMPIAGRLVRIARRRDYEHLHAHSCANAAGLALLVRLLTDVPYSMTLHGPLSIYGSHQRAKWTNAEFAITVTERLKGEVQQAIPELDASRIAVAPMGVDLDVFTRRSPYRPPQPGETWRLVTCGRLHRGKGHQEVIEAVSLLREQGRDVHLTILGEGTYRHELEQLVDELTLTDTVTLRGSVGENTVRDELENAHLFVLGSHDEAIGVATMEAMAMALPVVVTDVGGVRELVHDSVHGTLVEARSSTALADAIASLLDEPDALSHTSDGARRRVETAFSSRRSAELIRERFMSQSPQTTSATTASQTALIGAA